jgi:hypothetical protein
MSGSSIAGTIMQVAGDAQQDITNYITPYFTSKSERDANTEATKQIGKWGDVATGYIQPIADQGMSAFQRLAQGTQDGEYNLPQYQTYQPGTQAPTYQDKGAFNFNYQADPGYQARLQAGQGAITSAAAAGGNALSGSTLRALTKYNSDQASNEYAQAYGRAYNQFQNNRQFDYNSYLNQLSQWNANRGFGAGQATDVYNSKVQGVNTGYQRLASLANQGVDASGTLASMATGRGGTLADLAVSRGNIDASMWQGIGNASVNQGAHVAQLGSSIGGMGGSGGGGMGGSGGGGMGGSGGGSGTG